MQKQYPDLNKYKDTEIAVALNIPTALCLISQIQLAARHPDNNGPVRRVTEGFCRELQGIVCQLAPDLEDIVEKGWNPEYDVPIKNT